MKKVISALILFVLLFGTVYSRFFFDDRFFEIGFNTDVNVANNAIKIPDYFKKNVEIDLKEIADSIPSNGLDLAMNLFPSVKVKLNVPGKFWFEVKSDAEVYGFFNISKQLFDFIASGNNINENFRVDADCYFDAFYSIQAVLGIQCGILKVNLTPAVFAPVVHVKSKNSFAEFKNTPDGKFSIAADANVSLYTPIAVDIDNPQNMMNNYRLFDGMGFDLGGGAYLELLKFFGIGLNVRVPVVAGTLKKETSGDFEISMETDLQSIAGGNTPEPVFKKEIEKSIDTNYKINRPLKANAYIKVNLFDKYSYLFAGGGIGIRHPFAQDSTETKVYLEYNAGLRLSVFNVISFNLSTEYTNELFIHQFVLQFNLRLVEVDAGVGVSGTDFVNSFKVTGANAFIGASVGF